MIYLVTYRISFEQRPDLEQIKRQSMFLEGLPATYAEVAKLEQAILGDERMVMRGSRSLARHSVSPSKIEFFTAFPLPDQNG